jgi:hypothetical protein
VVGKRYKGPNGRYFAALTIQTYWRGSSKRRNYELWRKKQLAARVFVKYWKFKMIRRSRITAYNNKLDEALLYLNESNAKFKSQWGKLFQCNEHVKIILNSFGVSSDIKRQFPSVESIEANNFAR